MVCPKKYASIVLLGRGTITNLIHILAEYLASTGASIQSQWNNPTEYGYSDYMGH